jgi:hypothetical protein
MLLDNSEIICKLCDDGQPGDDFCTPSHLLMESDREFESGRRISIDAVLYGVHRSLPGTYLLGLFR